MYVDDEVVATPAASRTSSCTLSFLDGTDLEITNSDVVLH